MDLHSTGPQTSNYPAQQQVYRFYLPPPPSSLGCLAPEVPFAPAFSVSPCYQNFHPMGIKPPDTKSDQKPTAEVIKDKPKNKTCLVCLRPAASQLRECIKYICNRCRAFFRRFVRKERQGGGTWPCLTTREKITLPLKGDEKTVCDLDVYRSSCQPCRFLKCIGAGLKVASVTLTSDPADVTLNSTTSSGVGKVSPWRENEEVFKTQMLRNEMMFHRSGMANYQDREFGGTKIILMKKNPAPPTTSPGCEEYQKIRATRKSRKSPTDTYNVTNADYNNERWNKIMGPFLRNQPTVEDQLIAKLSGGTSKRAELVSPFKGHEGKAVILGKRNDIFCLKNHSQLPSIKLETIRRQENEMLAEKIIHAKSFLTAEKKEEKKLLKKMEEVAKKSTALHYNNLQKVVSQNNLQREIDNSYAKMQEKEKVAPVEQPFTITPLLPLGENVVYQYDDENNMEMRPVNPREVALPKTDETPTKQDLITNNDLSPDSGLSNNCDSGDLLLNLDKQDADNADFLDEFLVGNDDASLALALQSSQNDVSFLCSLNEGIQDPNIFENFGNDHGYEDEQTLVESIINTNERLANFNGIEI